MNWADWEMTWSDKHYQWFNNREEYIRGDKFDDNLIAIYKFSSQLACNNAFYELQKIYGIDGRLLPTSFCKSQRQGQLDEYFRIHFRCPELPTVVKVCEAFGGELCYWDTSRIEEPPDDGGVYVPIKKDAEKRASSGGCYIATVCYGNYDCTQVLTFRNFRDNYLSQRTVGKIFIKTYYAISPTIAKWLKNKHRSNTFIRKNILEQIYKFLSTHERKGA